jgi:hypothetical protein
MRPNLYNTDDIPGDLQPRASLNAARLQREWELMSVEEREEIYLPWLTAAKKVLNLDGQPDPSLVAANFAVQKVLDARAYVGFASLRHVFEIFGGQVVAIETDQLCPQCKESLDVQEAAARQLRQQTLFA